MQLVKCRKCGATIMSSDTLISNMQEEYNELTRQYKRAKGAEKQAIIQQMSHITKLMRQVLHNVAEVEVRKSEAYYELNLLKAYLKNNGIVNHDILDSIQAQARVTAKEKIAEGERALERLYGDFKNVCNNRTKRDPTADEAIKRT